MFRDLLASEFAPFRRLSEQELDRLESHYEFLSHWNKRMNLTRIRGLQETVRLHYCESLFVARVLPPNPVSIVDVGSGAGFPGVPLAILRPDCSVHLVESHQRKAVFLREATRNLPNVRVLPVRAQELQHEYDWIVARAVRRADLESLNLARNVAWLVSEADAVGQAERLTKIPWGVRRVLVTFHVKHAKI